MRARASVAVVLVLTFLYCWGLGWIAWGFSRAGGVTGWGLALSVAILLGLTVWVTWREVLFGLAAARLDRRYTAEAPPVGTDEVGPAAEFTAARRAIEDEHADDWRAWYRLGLAYDACRDRRHARESVRRAIRREREDTATSPTR